MNVIMKTRDATGGLRGRRPRPQRAVMRAILKTRAAGYTLIEVVAAAAIVAVGIAGAVSLSSSMMLQEDLSWRVSVARNYQENLAFLWQLGLSPNEVNNLMPSAAGNPKLSEVIGASPILVNMGEVDEDAMGRMEAAVSTFTVGTASIPGAGPASANAVTVYRPTLR